MIERHPLVTVVGPGGIGKTRLALAAAHRARAEHTDGVWMVELAPAANPALAISAIARTLELQLGADPQATDLAASVRSRRMLLVLDNCEHLLDSVAEIVAALRREAPTVRLLATSQELLRLPEEQVYRLGTLALRSRDEYWTTNTGQRIDRYAADIYNLRAALDWAVGAAEADLAIALTGASSWLWRDAGLHSEGLRRCEQAIKLINPATPTRLEARLHFGYVKVGRNRSLAATPALASGQRAVELYRQLGDRQALYVTLAE